MILSVAAIAILGALLFTSSCKKEDEKDETTTNIAPVAAFTITPNSGSTQTNFLFDASNSKDNEDATSVLLVRWDWENDGIWDTDWSSDKDVNHSYDQEGVYNVSMELKDTQGLTDEVSNSLVVSNSGVSVPIADFVVDKTNIVVGEVVNFSDQSSSIPTAWVWSFGDGDSSNVQNPNRSYSEVGAYTVSLTASNEYGSDTESKQNYILVNAGGGSSVADFVGTPTSGSVPLTVNFTDLSTNTPLVWSWDFGDGETSTLQNPIHTYQSTGSYTVKFTASNGNGVDPEIKTDYIIVYEDWDRCPGTPTVTDEGGNIYNTVQIGDQCWMKENLNYEIGASWCLDNINSNCDKFGRLYEWGTIMNGEASSNSVPSGVRGICPEGWHVPSDEEWKILEGTVDKLYGVGDPVWNGTGYRGSDAGKRLKTSDGWYNNGNGSNTSSFSALPGGYRIGGSGLFTDQNSFGYWATTREYGDSEAWTRLMRYEFDGVGRIKCYSKYNAVSVRCIKD